ncbi:DUF7373 family lipoprotein [Tsukamurella ocularis]|uniref:DUF7373 family lipoprotein n=1 Tax=Tsukamurella ocularis TaxID=1970234 RepID=UPI0039EF9177
MRNRSVRAVALAVTGVLVAGCGTVVDGTPIPDSSAPALALDTGGLSTEPRTVTASAAQRRVLAANRLAERLLLPTDVDPRFTRAGDLSVRAVVQASNLKDPLGDADAQRVGRRGIVYGFVSERWAPGDGVEEGVLMLGIRMADDAAARGAVDDFRAEGGATEVVDGRTDWAVRREAPVAGRKRIVFTAYAAAGPTLIIAIPWAIDETTSRARVAKALQMQIAKLQDYSGPGLAELDGLAPDQDSIVSHTVTPEPIESGTFRSYDGFRGRAAQLHWESNPATSASLFDEVGVDLVGTGRNVVYRARDAAGATRLAAGLAASWQRQQRARRLVIDGLADAQCWTYHQSALTDVDDTSCAVPVGRYVSTFSSRQATLARQVTSAGYLLLRKAP